MIFLRYESWKNYIRYYPVTCLILLANLIMAGLVLLNGGFTNETLIEFGAQVNWQDYSTQYWRYGAAIFLHGGFSHLLFNSFAILVFAPPLERLLGSVRYLVLYLGAGIVGNILSDAYYTSIGQITISVGASGAIYGVYGAFLYIALFQRHLMDEASRKTLYSLLIIGVLFSVAMANINWMAHFGGLISGFFIYGVMIRLFKRRTRA
ncbi:rhomboid family intramembrane serine protease [Paenibacillus sp. P96]|uniref:Rhomboid family intramembrane serine protease n=1 Tax=Paenibacillus zeirhizosphaerae TaxID=2987519 RepID=A0ABT9FST6_9BACL|nr:rhomboid family intramembrane serine protease [Paenibacillus sp. P96]MDP4097734.1 rhomboid family intramembrane serine protease [Paenibacillus sp. P96]